MTIDNKLLDVILDSNNKLNDIQQKLAENTVITKRNTEDVKMLFSQHTRMNNLLEIHIKRTNLLEQSLNNEKKKIIENQAINCDKMEKLDSRIIATESPIKSLILLAKIASITALVGGFAITVLKFIGY